MLSTRNLLILIATIVVLQLTGAFRWLGEQFDSPAPEIYSSTEVLNAALIDLADKLNEQLPTMVDDATRLDSVTAGDRLFRYDYTLARYQATEEAARAIDSSMHGYLQHTVCTSDEMQVFVRNRVTVVYRYLDRQGQEIVRISVKPEDCAGNTNSRESLSLHGE